jgi:hypothetical protein
MTTTDTDTLPQDDPAWHAWRNAGITATDIADAAAGTYGGAYGVVARKTGRHVVAQTAQMARGHRWQPTIADAIHILTGLHVVGEETWCEHADDPRWRATVDGFAARTPEATVDQLYAVVEIKTRGVGTTPNRARWDHQIQWQMLVTGQTRALLAEAAIDDTDDTLAGIQLRWIDADPAAQIMLQSIAEDLWAHLQAGTLPDPDSATALDIVKAVHCVANPEPEPVDLEPIAGDVARFVELRDAAKTIGEERDRLEARIREAVGDRHRGTTAGHTVTVSAAAKVITGDAEAQLLADHPELARTCLDRSLAKSKEWRPIVDTYRRAAGARRLTITTQGETTP